MPTQTQNSITLVIPAKNEAANLDALLPLLKEQPTCTQILIVDDGSTDSTRTTALRHGAEVVSLPYNQGNGAAVKVGAREAKGEILVFMDGDGQHDPRDIPRLIEKLIEGYDMAVGARDGRSQASIGRSWANRFYNWLASWMTNQVIDDLTSGYRAVRANKFREFLHLLPNGFSYPTTITMAFFRAGYPVAYVPIQAKPRGGRSHINPLRDGIRFLLIIFKIGTLYSPLKLFFPISLIYLLLGVAHYAFTFVMHGRFTNMSTLLISTSVIVFLFGLISEQITALMYSQRKE